MDPPDRWADWLIHGRQRGLHEHQIRAVTKALRRTRNRVLAGARLRRNASVLDVGAGTGLLAVEALRRVDESARIIALDTSRDALAQCARPGTALDLVAGDAVALPLPDQCMDVVVTRSVLIYVADKARAAKEFHRVLRPGGRVSLPNMVRYEEAAREVLGSAADEHLAALVSALTKRPSTSVDAGAYLRARRARR